MKLLIRDIFPEIKVETTKGIINLPKDYEGKWFVLFSHPVDFTPVCTTEFVSFQKKKKQFDELGAELIGLIHPVN
ncbi:redoxin domain-containing protein [Clostridium sp. ZS2-4]|uniref:redoxin domain-containing protein n=1 Tax=Clostridium sp. ZS2-4 TaxID=2987703 RepID=UPI00227C4283|nr:redoxin domain-containing protein [Clostridium sp. ZS2-4]MCY6356279.1 redoxin domain-containing protein [Clostridium sp. ZS2-4]